MSEHTPGPWRWGYWHLDGDYVEFRPANTTDDLVLSVCEYGYHIHNQRGRMLNVIAGKIWTNRADMRLIASAPDLLNACKEFVRFAELPNVVSRGEYIRYQVEALAVARTAIAQAEGGP